MAVIQKVLLEEMPEVKLIGRRYTNADWDAQAAFGPKWCEWFQNGYFDRLRVCTGIQHISDDFIGAMRTTEAGYEYWIGILMAVTDEAPAGFESVVIPAGKLCVCYVYGNEASRELYGMEVHKACVEEWNQRGWSVRPDAWYFERYNCPRFTAPDEKGNVILDYCGYLDEAE